MKSDIARAVDANLNRITEGLRVAEDIFRYTFDNAEIQQQLKQIRHAVCAACPAENYISARAAGSDVGFAAKGQLEYERESLNDIMRSNLKRVQEGLRVMEELFKLEDPATSETMKGLRYKIYDLDRDILKAMQRKTLGRGLYLVLTNPSAGYQKLTELAVEAGLPAVQLRYKGRDMAEMLKIARQMRSITTGSETLFVVNDRPDIALLSDADCLHIGQSDLPPVEARKLVGDMLLGLSTHNLDQVQAANDEPVDYIGFGPIYVTNSKEIPDPVVGPDLLGQAHKVARHPIVGIGGLDLTRINNLDKTACNNVAVIRAVTEADDPLEAMQTINNAFLEI